MKKLTTDDANLIIDELNGTTFKANTQCQRNDALDEINRLVGEINDEINDFTKNGAGSRNLAKEYGVSVETIRHYHNKYKKLPHQYVVECEDKIKTGKLLKLMERELKIRKLKRNRITLFFNKLLNKN